MVKKAMRGAQKYLKVWKIVCRKVRQHIFCATSSAVLLI